jgi:hypothetical protein
MELLPQDIRALLLANGASPVETDQVPVVKYLDPSGAATWSVTGLMPPEDVGEDDGIAPDIRFGLCDLGPLDSEGGCPELGTVGLAELRSVTGRLGLGIERDLTFRARYPLSVYAHGAVQRARIVESDGLLAESAAILGAWDSRAAPVADSVRAQADPAQSHSDIPSEPRG